MSIMTLSHSWKTTSLESWYRRSTRLSTILSVDECVDKHDQDASIFFLTSRTLTACKPKASDGREVVSRSSRYNEIKKKNKEIERTNMTSYFPPKGQRSKREAKTTRAEAASSQGGCWWCTLALRCSPGAEGDERLDHRWTTAELRHKPDASRQGESFHFKHPG